MAFATVGDVLGQVRTLLQDTDNSSGSYRYQTDSLIVNLNQGMLEAFRIRPDIFLEVGFTVPQFTVVGDAITIEAQWVPPLIYYVVGLTQARDDEQTQDQRSAAFLQTFKQALAP